MMRWANNNRMILSSTSSVYYKHNLKRKFTFCPQVWLVWLWDSIRYYYIIINYMTYKTKSNKYEFTKEHRITR